MRELPRCLSVKQPWAHWIIHGDEAGDHHRPPSVKDVENRDRPHPRRGLTFIHASKGHEPEDREIVLSRGMATGGIIGVVDIWDMVEESDSPWFLGKYGFLLRDPRPIPLIPCSGTIFPLLWEAPGHLHARLHAELDRLGV